ncbi:TetR family transcriptional regulator [Streptosporangium sp. NPDC050855]|uniref:TetR family transcriptional regulator n=1 Tax=Streptosporangium sp. NPDC050855 TaxID=3366194 RepID=UPI003796F093
MGRWEPNARGRLEQAALELYLERGFERTSVADIAERAGLTERTFFRHYTDKREVLFAGSSALRELLEDAAVRAPEPTPLIEVVEAAFRAAAVPMQERQEQVRRRQAVIAATPELQERELIKLASLSDALAEALRRRGVDDVSASLVAETGIAVFKVAFRRWTEQDGKAGETGKKDLSHFIGESFAGLKAVTGKRAGSGSRTAECGGPVRRR